MCAGHYQRRINYTQICLITYALHKNFFTWRECVGSGSLWQGKVEIYLQGLLLIVDNDFYHLQAVSSFIEDFAYAEWNSTRSHLPLFSSI